MGESKTLWHSQLAEMDWQEVAILTDVMPSKFRGKPDYVRMEVGGAQRLYQIENEQCGNQLRGLNGKRVVLRAIGSREEADIEFDESFQPQEGEAPPALEPPKRQNKAPANPPRTQTKAPPSKARENRQSSAAPPPPRTDHPAPEPPASAPKQIDWAKNIRTVQNDFGREANLMLIAIGAGIYVKDRIREKYNIQITDAHFQTICSSLYIGADRRALGGYLPTADLAAHLKQYETPPPSSSSSSEPTTPPAKGKGGAQ